MPPEACGLDWLDADRWPRAARAALRLRPATGDDLPLLLSVYASTRTEELAPVPWSAAEKSAFLVQQATQQHAAYAQCFPEAGRFVIEHGEHAIGRLYLDRRGAADHVLDIALLPVARGQGFGGALLGDLIDAAGAAGRLVSIYVERMNPARRLYARLGFRVVVEGDVYDLMHRSPGTAPTPQANTA